MLKHSRDTNTESTLPSAHSSKVTHRVNATALELLEQHPRGLRWSELLAKIQASDPSFHPKTVNGCVWKLVEKYPDRVYKPSKGLFRLVRYKAPVQDTEPSTKSSTDYDVEAAQAEWDSPKRAQKLVEKFIHESSAVLDIGIGTGQAVDGYREKGARIIGIDKDKAMLKAARETTGDAGVMRLGDINERLPVEDLEGQIDVAQAIGVLEFAEDIESVFNQVVPTLKEGGVFVFTIEALEDNVNKKTEYFPGADVTVYRRSPEEIHELLADKGLRLLQEAAYKGYNRGNMNGAKVPYHIFLAQKQPSL